MKELTPNELQAALADVARILAATIERTDKDRVALNTLIGALLDELPHLPKAVLKDATAESADEVKGIHAERIQSLLELEHTLRGTENAG
jgi:hypothetical protein